MKRRHSAFTLLEILAVVAVILILLAIAVMGMKGAGAKTEADQAKVLLESLNAMLNEYKSKGGDMDLLDAIAAPPTAAPAAMVSKQPMDGQVKILYDRTRVVMARLVRDPNVRKMVDALPPDRVKWENATYGGVTVFAPLVLDPWGNPIVYVPGRQVIGNTVKPGGLSNVNRGAQTTPGSSSVTWALKGLLIQSPADKAFFASSGQDHNFQNGDDNIYSFKE